MMNSVPYVASNKGVEVMAQYLPEEVAFDYFTDIVYRANTTQL